MEYTKNKSNLVLLVIVFFAGSTLAGVYLTGCGGTGDIPTASMAQGGKVELSWKEVPGAISYNLYMSTSPGVDKLSGYRISRVASPITITGLETGTTYYFVMTVVDASGEGSESIEMSYTAEHNVTGAIELVPALKAPAAASQSGSADKATPANDRKGTPPGSEKNRPTRSTKTDKTDADGPDTAIGRTATGPQSKAPEKAAGKMTVAWENVPNAASYNIYWRTTRGVTKRNGNKISGVNSPYTFTGLDRGATYYFVVTSVSPSGESQESEELSFTVPE